MPGIYVVANAQRYYKDGLATSHLIGYTSAVTKSELIADEYYLQSDRVGRSGLESQYETELRGQHRSIDFNKEGFDTMAYDENDTGNNLILSVNEEVQNYLYKTMKSVFDSSGVNNEDTAMQW